MAWHRRAQCDRGREPSYTLIMGTTVFIALVALLSNLLADVIYAIADPRIAYE